MKLIHQNPFRIVGLLSNATLKETTKRKSKINAFLSVNQSIDSEFDFDFLEKIERKKSSVNKAFADIQQGKDKVNHSLFWFLNAKPYDNTAIEYLKKGAKEKALDIWNKITIDKEVNSNNFSAFNNLGTYKLLSKKKSDIKIGIEAKIKLIESEYFESFVHSVADETFTVDNQKQAEKLIDELLKQFKKQFRDLETLQLFDGCNTTTQKYLSAKFTEGPIHKIETQVEQSKKERKSGKDKTYAFGLKLFTNTKDDLSLLNSLLGENNLKYKSIADQLANEIMQCAIDYFNESQENGSDENYLESAQKLTKLE